MKLPRVLGATVAAHLFLLLLASPPARARPGDVERSLRSPAATPTGLAFDGRSLWVADRNTLTIYGVDPATGAVRARLKAPGWEPEGLAWDGQALWAADRAQAKLYRIDPRSRRVVHTLDAPAKSPRGLAWIKGVLWVADDGRKELIAINPKDGAELRSLPVPSPHVRGVAWDGRYLWVGDRIADRIYLCDPGRGDVLFSVPTPGPHVQGLVYDPRAKRLWAVDYETDTIYQLRADDGTTMAHLKSKWQRLDLIHTVRNLGPDPLEAVEVFVAVPGNRATQEIRGVSYTGGQPRFLKDRQGQQLARFAAPRLEAGKTLRVAMQVEARLRGAQWFIFPHKVGSLREIPGDVRRRYLGDDPKYQLKNKALRQAVAEVVKQERHPYWIARRLARAIGKRMRYIMVGGWEAAPVVWERGTGSCSEYTFLFVAMCRAAGVPARWVGAVVVRGDDASYDQAFHRWAEIYLPGYGWVPFDVQHADKPSPAAHARGLGHLGPRVLVTTVAGGYSDQLGWSYNTNARYRCAGRCQVASDAVGEWSPAPRSTRRLKAPFKPRRSPVSR